MIYHITYITIKYIYIIYVLPVEKVYICTIDETHCNTLQGIATHCNTLQRTAMHCNALQRATTHCNTLEQHHTYEKSV